MFNLVSDYAPAGDQPQAMAKLTVGSLLGAKPQTLPGVRGVRTDAVVVSVAALAHRSNIAILQTWQWK